MAGDLCVCVRIYGSNQWWRCICDSLNRTCARVLPLAKEAAHQWQRSTSMELPTACNMHTHPSPYSHSNDIQKQQQWNIENKKRSLNDDFVVVVVTFRCGLLFSSDCVIIRYWKQDEIIIETNTRTLAHTMCEWNGKQNMVNSVISMIWC